MSVIVSYVHGGMLHEEFASNLLDFVLHDKGPTGRHVIGGRCSVGGLYVADNRNQVCKRFLGAQYPDGTKPQWLFFLDTDILFKPSDFYSILDAADPVERPIVGGLYFGYMDGYPTPVWRNIHKELKNVWGTMATVNIGAIQQVDAVGMGFTVIHRSVLESIQEEFKHDNWTWFAHDIYKGERLGEDLTFCYRAAQLGHTTWGDARVIVGHNKVQTIRLKHFTDACDRAKAASEKQNQSTGTAPSTHS